MKKFSIVLVVIIFFCFNGLTIANESVSKLDQKLIDELTYKDKVEVIIRLIDDTKINLQTLDGTIKHEYKIFKGFSGTFSVAAIEKLAKNPNVAFISKDHQRTAFLNYSSPTINAPTAWTAGYSGQGVSVAIIDTGIDGNHPALSNRVVGWYDAINGQTSPYDDNGHGTHCAGIVGSHDALYKGVAPECDLIGVKVLNAQGSGYDSDIIAGMEWAVLNGADIISMSLGAKAFTDPANDPLCVACVDCWNEGVVVVVAAGNSGPRPRSIDSPGIDPTIITVAAADDKNTIEWADDDIARFSSVGPTRYGDLKPDIAAPGVGIQSCDANSTGWVSLSGTSMATPHVAGAIALILEAHPTYTPGEIKDLLMTTANDLGLDYNYQGKGEIDVWAVLNK